MNTKQKIANIESFRAAAAAKLASGQGEAVVLVEALNLANIAIEFNREQLPPETPSAAPAETSQNVLGRLLITHPILLAVLVKVGRLVHNQQIVRTIARWKGAHNAARSNPITKSERN